MLDENESYFKDIENCIVRRISVNIMSAVLVLCPPLITSVFCSLKILKKRATVNVFDTSEVGRMRMQNLALFNRMLPVMGFIVMVTCLTGTIMNNIQTEYDTPLGAEFIHVICEIVYFVAPFLTILTVGDIRRLFSKLKRLVIPPRSVGPLPVQADGNDN